MIVKLNIEKKTCQIVKEKNDKRFKISGWASAESTFLYNVLKELKDEGYDFIKKRMCKDGHLVDDHQQYIRTRNIKRKHVVCIFNGCYALYDIGLEFNMTAVGDHVSLMVEIL